MLVLVLAARVQFLMLYVLSVGMICPSPDSQARSFAYFKATDVWTLGVSIAKLEIHQLSSGHCQVDKVLVQIAKVDLSHIFFCGHLFYVQGTAV